MHDEVFTPSGVRLRVHVRRPGRLHWLLLPGGPGLGSQSLRELADAIAVPGTTWLVDLPGDGSNTHPPGAGDDPYANWPAVLLEAAQALQPAVFVGHSTGGMYLLSVPALEWKLRGLALISTAPHAGWRTAFAAMADHSPLPGVASAAGRFAAEPTAENLRELVVASAAWNFPPETLPAGARMLARLPYNPDAVAWSATHFDETYRCRWWPARLPTLICAGSADRVICQELWEEPRFAGTNVIRRTIAGGGHFPWLDRPDQVRSAFADLTRAIGG